MTKQMVQVFRYWREDGEFGEILSLFRHAQALIDADENPARNGIIICLLEEFLRRSRRYAEDELARMRASAALILSYMFSAREDHFNQFLYLSICFNVALLADEADYMVNLLLKFVFVYYIRCFFCL
jgi:hypothetical protein